ncbi:hypothetical protein [Heliophilum fasciatum]|uniref:hypothetical protein n=1 Tax=Heliophilum fasciatum TaxID=35700 RepID=UPI001047C150|nr:hypothetical protein [Heliophilum fasciatum]MCW2278826.1 flagellar operon protein (TIGR03826 family) [Heliophilum fasciatum]
MSLRNCVRCGRLYAPQRQEKICPICFREEESRYEDVVEYLRDHPGASHAEVAHAVGVEEQTIYRFIEEGRLEVGGASYALHRCQRCGCTLQAGRHCAACQEELARELRGAVQALSLRTENRIATEDTKNKVFSRSIRK